MGAAFGVIRSGRPRFDRRVAGGMEIRDMRPTLIVLFMVVWLYARVSGYTLGGRADVLPVVALLIALFGGRQRPRPV